MSNMPDGTPQWMVDRAAWDDGDLADRYEPGCALSATINIGPLDVATMQAALERLEASLTDDERAAVSAVITVEPK